ncbi:hypothetical protein BIW11_03228 [Tropilaelaps mercedesae]|uniref:Uncharacterized protein n=1 Tax=Tropilaelaps mercedesae TaxID=418985 RepID=A0A1V9XQ60_9ACAR|nr:hypothetical protein BIW11_03228 [Tropilaelaps mercedesae]
MVDKTDENAERTFAKAYGRSMRRGDQLATKRLGAQSKPVFGPVRCFGHRCVGLYVGLCTSLRHGYGTLHRNGDDTLAAGGWLQPTSLGFIGQDARAILHPGQRRAQANEFNGTRICSEKTPQSRSMGSIKTCGESAPTRRLKPPAAHGMGALVPCKGERLLTGTYEQ